MMQEMNSRLKSILDFLMEKREFDFSGYHPAMLERRIGQRLTAAGDKLSALFQPGGGFQPDIPEKIGGADDP